MSELKSLTLNGTKYDSFVDQTAREMAQGGGSGGSSEWRLLRTVVLEESEDKTITIEVTTDEDGKPFECDEIALRVTSAIRSNGWSYSAIKVNGLMIGEECGNKPVFVLIKNIGGLWKALYVNAGYTNGTWTTTGLLHKGFMYEVSQYPKITSLGIGYCACNMEVWGR